MMKTLASIFFASFFLLIFHHGQSQDWQWLSPLPQGNDLWSVKFADSNTGYAVGEDNTILKTIDGGEHWDIISWGGEICDYTSLAIIDLNTVIVVGGMDGPEGVILKTTNGGVDWTVNSEPVDAWLSSVFFTGPSTGYAVGGGDAATILKTTDGGVHWSTQVFEEYDLDFESIFFVDQHTGFTASRWGYILKTTDAGMNWELKWSQSNYMFYSIFFFDPDNGYAAGLDHNSGGIVAKSTDGGETWFTQLEDECEPLFSIYFINNNVGYAVGDYGLIIETADGGNNWEIQYREPYYTFYSVHFSEPGFGYAVGEGGNMFKFTEEQEWACTSWRAAHNLNAVYFTNEYTGFVAGASYDYSGHDLIGVVLKTTDGGASWMNISPGLPQEFNDIQFRDDLHGCAVGGEGTIIHTIDGGEHWTNVNTGISENLNSVCFASENNCFAVGDHGTMLKSENGGKDWYPIDPGSNDPFHDVQFLDDDMGFVAASEAILKTVNGGVDWIAQSTQYPGTLYTVYFVDENTGFAGGRDQTHGILLKTTNGGDEWTALHYDSPDRVSSIYFTDENTGYITCGSLSYYSGSIFKTTNGGVDWIKFTISSNISYTSVFMTGPSAVYVAGDYGTILRSPPLSGYGVYDGFTGEKPLLVWPNPAANHFTIDLSGFHCPTRLTLFDISGKQIYDHLTREKYFKHDISALPPGIYLIRIIHDHSVITKKIIKP